MLERLALAHPHIAFSLKRDGKQVFKLPAQNLHERIAAIVGDDFQTASLEIDSGNGALRLYGAIAKPTFAKRQNRQTNTASSTTASCATKSCSMLSNRHTETYCITH